MDRASYWVTFSIRCMLILACVLTAATGATRAEPAAPATDAVVQPPCDEAAFVTALNAVNNGTLTFNCGSQKTITFTSQKTLAVGKSVTLDGDGAIKLSGNIFHRLFIVNAGAALTLTNITVAGGGGEFGFDAGGAIQNLGTLKVKNSRFVGNLTGANYGGGAIYSHGALVIEDSVFESNSAGAGGAIYTQKITGAPGTLIISNTQFISNTSVNYYGGGIANLGWLTMTNVLMQGNQDQATTASGHGGAGLANYEAGTAVLNNVTFSQNAVLSYTNYGGGGIANWGVLTMTGGLVTQNQLPYTVVGIYSNAGGGIYNEGNTGGPGRMSLSGVVVTDNSASHGGGIMNDGTLILFDNILSSNRAGTDGGGIANIGTMTVTNVTFSDNSAPDFGGGISNRRLFDSKPGIAALTNVTLSGNSAYYGGGIDSNYGATVTLTNVILSGNSATWGGGIRNASTATLTNVTLKGNSAQGGGGGGIYNDLGGAVLALTSVTVDGNSATSGGGIYNKIGTTVLTNLTLDSNSAAQNGGGIYNLGIANLTNVTLSGNSATSGGGVYNTTGNTVTLKNSIVANGAGGGNCGGAALTNNNSDKYSLSSDNTCALAGTGSRNNIDPLLTALGNYGGPTQVHMLKAGSPAINGVVGSDAPSTDQRGKPRPQGGGFDIGAVERQSGDSDLVPRVYLPLMIR